MRTEKMREAIFEYLWNKHWGGNLRGMGVSEDSINHAKERARIDLMKEVDDIEAIIDRYKA